MPRKGHGLRVERRADTGALTIVGTIPNPAGGPGKRVRERASSDNPRLAAEQAKTLEAEILRTFWHGPRRGTRPLADAVALYIETAPRSQSTLDRLARLVRAAGETKLADIRQETINKLARTVLRPGAAPATLERGVIVPLRAVMRLAADEGWCDSPRFRTPKREAGRTLYLLPADAELLLDAAGLSHRILIRFILSTGARMAEAIEVDWRDIDLVGARAIFWRTKTRRRRVAHLPPALVATLANLPERNGPVIRRPDGAPYEDRGREMGGQIKTAWKAILRRAVAAGAPIPDDLTPHDLRHSWASWHYALYRDVIRLKTEGGWSSLEQVERYVHLLPQGHEAAIAAFWHGAGTAIRTATTSY